MRINYNYGNKERKLVAVTLAVLYLILTVAMTIINRRGNVLIAGQASISGIITAFQFGIALAMVIVDYEVGGKLGLILVACSAVMPIIRMIAVKDFSSIPGLCYYVVCFLAIRFMIYRISRERKNAFVDDLTGLSNRKHIALYINHLISSKAPFYVVFFDLNNFKIINDTYGHKIGDGLLKELAEKWDKLNNKTTYIGRFGGDEFILVVKKNKVDDIESFVNEYIEVVKNISEENDGQYSSVSVSAGIVEYPINGKMSEELLRKAAITADRARNVGRNLYTMYYDYFELEFVREQQIEKRIKKALEDGLFYMVYQPQFETSSKKLRGFESLIRMEAEDEPPLYPGDFIPVAEKSDLIIDIGEYVIKRVIADFAPIINAGKDITISINISAKQMLSRNFTRVLRKALDDSGFKPGNLEIEVTEYCMVETTDEAIAVINEIKRMGVKLAMDDFGTGYSSFSYLTKLPIDLIKIDKSIIDELGQGEIVGALCSMGHSLSCEIIAEGVEHEEQLEILKEKGCDFIQGFIWGKPMSYTDAVGLL